jgi:hypothetical protein
MEFVSLATVAVIIIAAFAFALWPMFQPSGSLNVSGVGTGGGIEEEVARLLIERENAYRNIREIEMDREMDKLSDEDYEEMIGQAREGALNVLRRLEAQGVSEGMVPAHLSEGGAVDVAYRPEVAAVAARSGARELSLDERLEAEILQYRNVRPVDEEGAAGDSSSDATAAPDMNFCSTCGAPVQGAHNFCSSCGNKLK